MAKMEIEIPEDIDISQCPGLVEINKFTPNWKKEMIEKKNKEKIEEYVKVILKQRENEAKWRNVPEWKRALLMKKDQEDQVAALVSTSPSPEKKATSTPKGPPPTPPKAVVGGDHPSPSPKPKGDHIPAALGIDPAEFESMPPWKRELLMKRDKIPPTFGNEFNPDEDELHGQDAAHTHS